VSETSSTPPLAQPAYTTGFLSTILKNMFIFNTNSYPQPNGYNVQVLSSGNTVDQTTNVEVNGYADQFTNGSEVTTVTFLAKFNNTNPYQFNEVRFYTQVNGQNSLEVADFVFTSNISKPSGYVLILSFNFSISTPLSVIFPSVGLMDACNSNCPNVNCNSVADNIPLYVIPFSLFNFIFIYLLGITLDYLKSLPNIQQDAQQYSSCTNQCFNSCNSGGSTPCQLCQYSCLSALEPNPIAIFIVSQNISNLTDLLPSGFIQMVAVNVCQGQVDTYSYINSENLPEVNIDASNPSQIIARAVFSFPGINSYYNALYPQIYPHVFTYYTLGIFYFQGNPSPSGTDFTFTVTLSQS
jgi:hypothetical protein